MKKTTFHNIPDVNVNQISFPGFGISTETGRKLFRRGVWEAMHGVSALAKSHEYCSFGTKWQKMNLRWLHYFHFIAHPSHHSPNETESRVRPKSPSSH